MWPLDPFICAKYIQGLISLMATVTYQSMIWAGLDHWHTMDQVITQICTFHKINPINIDSLWDGNPGIK